jgi:uncharacterized membrane protein YcaP (DUF421 family)
VPDWSAMFIPKLAIGEVILRGSIMYLFLFVAMRFLLKRQGGAFNIADLLVVVAVVDVAQPAFSGEAKSITESVIYVLTIMFWAWLLNWASFHYPALTFLTGAPPLELVRDGRMNRAAMAQVLMTKEELLQALRESGIDRIEDVRRAVMEGDGQISVMSRSGKSDEDGGAGQREHQL